MATPKYSAKDATVDDSDDSTPNGSNGDVAVSSGSKPGVDQIRKSDDKADAPKADAAEPDDSTPDDSKADDSKATASKPNAPKDGGTEADGVKRASPKVVQTPADTGTIQEALTKFKSSIEHGLTQEEAASRLKKDGPNAIEEKHISPLKRFLTFLWGPIPWMIEIAAVLSAVVRHWEDFVIIFFMLALNAVVGFWEEFKADNEIEALKKNLALHSRVLRDGKWSDVEAKTLVTGDIVMVKLGNVIPADLKLVDGDYLSIDQSALTGESLPVDKKKNDVAYSGSIVRMGQMNGLVVATGMNTLFGRTARLVESVTDRLPLSEGGPQDRQFPHSDHARPGRIDPDGRAISRRPAGRNPAICADSYRRCDPGRLARRPVRHDGRRRIRARSNEGHRLPPRRDRRDGRHGHSLLGQDRHAHQERAQVGQSGRFQGEQRTGPDPGRGAWPRERRAAMASTRPCSKLSAITRR